MAMSWLKQISSLKQMSRLKQKPGRKPRSAQNHRRRARIAPLVEALDARVMLAVTASFAEGTVRVTGDDQDNVITISRNAAGTILVNNGAIPIQGGTATVANTNHFHIVGGAGDDNISLDEANGRLPGAAIFGGAGNDVLTGGSGDDFIEGETGNDTAVMGAGDDTFSWNPGDGSDVVDGQADLDTVVFNGSDLAEKFGIADSGAGAPFHRVRLTRDIGSVVMDLGTVEDIDLNALGGADTVTVDDQTATDLFTVNLDLQGTAAGGDGQVDAVIINGTDGDDVGQVESFGARITANASLFPFVSIIGADATKDTLTINALGGGDTLDASSLAANLIGLTLNGGDGGDEIFGSPGNDQVIGGAGHDKVFMDAGDDNFVWNPGDGNDVVEGQDGTDTVIFNGASAGENIDLSADGPRLRLTDDVGNVDLDVDGIEQTSVAPLGGADNVVVNDLTGTALTHIKVRLSADGQPDHVIVNGSNNADTIDIDGDFANGVTISGLAAQVKVNGAIEAAEGLTVNALGGADTVDASTLEAGAIALTLNGGDGTDLLTSSQGDNLINGGAQTDTINVIGSASGGVTTVQGSSGDDAVNVNPGGVGPANVLFDATERIGALTIAGGGVATLAAGGVNVLTVTSLNITGTGKLNLNDNALIVDYAPGSPSPIAGIQSLLASGFHGGAWNGNGIVSGSADASTFALGFAEAAEVAAGGTFAGQTVDRTAVVVKFTLYGDATLDGKVDFNDVVRLAQNFNTNVSAAAQGSWSRGDFTYDGVVAFNDLVMLAQNFQRPAPAIDVGAPAQPTAMAVAQATNPLAGSFQRRPARPHAKAPAKHWPFRTV